MAERPASANRHQAPPPDRKALNEMARRAWLRDGIAILWPDRIADPWDRQHVLNLANALYGERHE